jgi:hypothetical protein
LIKLFDVSVLTNGKVPEFGAVMPESVIQMKIVPPVVPVRLMDWLFSKSGRLRVGLENPLMEFPIEVKLVPAIGPEKVAPPAPEASGIRAPFMVVE